MTNPTTSQGAEELVERLRKRPLPVCPFDRRSPDYWTAGEDGKPCPSCGATEAIEDARKCPGADLRILDQAASLLLSQQAEIEALKGDRARLDWLEHQCVEVRTPARWGSHANFFAKPDDSFEGEEGPSDIRAKIDAAKKAEGSDHD